MPSGRGRCGFWQKGGTVIVFSYPIPRSIWPRTPLNGYEVAAASIQTFIGCRPRFPPDAIGDGFERHGTGLYRRDGTIKLILPVRFRLHLPLAGQDHDAAQEPGLRPFSQPGISRQRNAVKVNQVVRLLQAPPVLLLRGPGSSDAFCGLLTWFVSGVSSGRQDDGLTTWPSYGRISLSCKEKNTL